MKNKKVIALIILSIGAVISLIYGITAPGPGGSRRSSRHVENVSDDHLTLPSSRIVPTRRLTKTTEFESWGRSPFAFEKILEKKSSALILNGILWDETNPAAMINDEIVSVGDTISDKTVVEITPTAVILDDKTKLQLAEE